MRLSSTLLLLTKMERKTTVIRRSVLSVVTEIETTLVTEIEIANVVTAAATDDETGMATMT